MSELSSENTLWPEPVVERPGLRELERMVFASVVTATDGCIVEPDGVCPHGYPSWLIQMGVI